jgi:hypothetical protein
MTPQDFIDKWRNVDLKERTASHSHFLDLCRLLEIPAPVIADKMTCLRRHVLALLP